MARVASTPIEALLANLPAAPAVRHQARALGVVRRQGKVDAYALLMTVVLGIAVRGPAAIAQLGHVMAQVTGVRLARSSFWARFTPSFADLVKWLLDQFVDSARAKPPRPPGVLSAFRDVIAVDTTFVKVHDKLVSHWRGTRRHSAKAALKVHAWVRAFTGELLKYRVTAETFADCRGFGVDHGLKDCLVLLDRGYSSPSLWRRIDNVGGYFLTRLPADRNPTVTGSHIRHRGRARKVTRRKLRELLPGLQRKFLDVGAMFRCKVRKYRSKRNRWITETFRLVCVRDRKTGRYAVYVTNAPPELLPVDAVAATYRLRWEVETFFRSAKSGSGLTELPSSKPAAVEAFVYASLIRATTAMQSLARFRRFVAHPRGLLVNPGQWLKWWNRQLHRHLDEAFEELDLLSLDALALMLADPNVGRPTNRAKFLLAAYAA